MSSSSGTRGAIVVAGSLDALAERSGQSLAESFLNAEIVILVDTSGSMGTDDSQNNQKRYDVACSELAKLQRDLPGKVAVIAFSDDPEFAPGGHPRYAGGGTNLSKALRFVQPADGTVRFVVISDGLPDNEGEALQVARTFTSRIDTVYVGPEHDRSGAAFLERLARAAGGKAAAANRVLELAEKVKTLMLMPGTC